LVLGDQKAECLLVTGLYALNQYPVRFAISHELCYLFSSGKKVCGSIFNRRRV